MADGVIGQQRTFDSDTEYNTLSFIIRQHLGRVRIAIPVKVTAVHGGGIGPAPTVDVQVQVNLIDGVGTQYPAPQIFGLPVLRIQGGTNVIVIDPVIGDVGQILVNDRDISAAKKNAGATSNPGSFRRFNLADAVYLGAILNAATPTQYIEMTSTGITITDKNGNTVAMSSSGINLNGVVIDSDGNISTPGEVTAKAGAGTFVTLSEHVHTANNVPPTPGH